MRHQTALFVMIVFTSCTFSGCAPAVIMINKIPELKGGSPLGDISPLNFVIHDFVDARMIENPHKVGYGILGFNHNVLADREAKDLVRQTIVLELKRNGHQVLEPQEKDKADVIIDGSVQELWVGATGLYSGEIRASTKIKITANSLKLEKSLSKIYQGIASQNVTALFKFVNKEGFERLLNDALLSMVKEFTMDPDFLEVLQKVKKQPSAS